MITNQNITIMKRYDDYKNDDSSSEELTREELSRVVWTKYVIITSTETDKRELMEAFEHIHYSDIDTGFVTVNQLAHEYLDEKLADGVYNNIVVDEALFSEAQRSIVTKKKTL